MNSILPYRLPVTAMREATLADREAAIAEREAALADREAKLARREQRVAEREAAVATREAALHGESTTSADRRVFPTHLAVILPKEAGQNGGSERAAGTTLTPKQYINVNVQRRRTIDRKRARWLNFWWPQICAYHGHEIRRTHYLASLVYKSGGLFDDVPLDDIADAVGKKHIFYRLSWQRVVTDKFIHAEADVPTWLIWMQLKQRYPRGRYFNGGQRFLVTQLGRVLKGIIDQHTWTGMPPSPVLPEPLLSPKFTEPFLSAPKLPHLSTEGWIRLLLGWLEKKKLIRRKNRQCWLNDPYRLDLRGYEPGSQPILLPDDPLS